MTQNPIAIAARNLRRAPAFTGLVVLTLALGIGATTAMFSVVDAALINPLPFPHADRIVEVWIHYEEGASRSPAIMNQVVAAVRQERALFDAVSGYNFESGTLTDAGEPENLSLVNLSPDVFAMLPAAPLAGRLFTLDDVDSAARALLISEKLWISRFGRDPQVIGRVVTINDQPNRIIGVLSTRFVFPDSDRDGWRPIDIDANARARVMIVALRKAGVDRRLIDDRLKALTQSMREAGALPPGQFLATEEPMQFGGVGRAANGLYLLLAAAVVLALLACVNVSNLMLVRASSRQAELALRVAVGASRRQLLSEAALESVVLAAIGGIVGLWLARVFLDVLLTIAPPQIQSAARYVGTLDPRAIWFAAALTLITSVLWSVLPAWRALQIDAIDALKSARSTITGRDAFWQGALVSTQLALVVVLLAGAGLLLRSFIKLNQVDFGFNPDRLVVLNVQLTQPRYAAPGAALGLVRQIEHRIEEELGLHATVGSTPIRAGGYSDAHPEAEGQPQSAMAVDLPLSRVSGDYFDVLQIPIVDGRTFLPEDGSDAVIVNDVFAKRYFGDASPIGRRVRTDADQPWMTVIGVAADVKTMGPTDSVGEGMEIYVGYHLTPRTYNYLTVVAAIDGGHDPAAILARIKQIAWDLDPKLPVVSAHSMRDQVADSIARPRFLLSLSGAFTICAVLIAAIGVYGVSAFWVARRRRELAIHMAIGASPDRVVLTVLARSLKLAAIGTFAGLLIALGGARVMESLLFATDPRDPLTFVATTLMLAVIAIAACLGPAVKASRVDPMTTLRTE